MAEHKYLPTKQKVYNSIKLETDLSFVCLTKIKSSQSHTTTMTEYQDFMAIASKFIERDPDANWLYRYIIDGLADHGFSTKMSETYAALIIGQELFHPSESDFSSYLSIVESAFPQLSHDGHATMRDSTKKCVQDYYSTPVPNEFSTRYINVTSSSITEN